MQTLEASRDGSLTKTFIKESFSNIIDKNDLPSFESMFKKLSHDLFRKNIKMVSRAKIMTWLSKISNQLNISTNCETHVLTRDIMKELHKSRNGLISIIEFEAAAQIQLDKI
jgi:hypothetical protein